MMIIYFILMMLMFMISLFMSLILFYLHVNLNFEWLIMGLNSMNIEMYVLVDWMSMLFIGVIFLISSMIMIYSIEYMGEDKFIIRFYYLVILFIFSMILMILSPNIISILFGWDGLGLVSYCLVIYYQNYISYNSGMVTVLSNRVGDVGFLMMIGLMIMKGSWSIWAILGSNKLLVFMMVLAAVTKSAMMPFSVWLPMAMAAPTPVSALVHSSTLVTAGVYLLVRFNKILMLSYWSEMMFYLSVLTMFMAGVMANIEYDLKKIIALSTLSQLGLMMMILSLGMEEMAYFHLLTHALFKSMLFMCAGILIHSMLGNQDIRLCGNLNMMMPFTMLGFIISSGALCGVPFMTGFYSKDLLIEYILFNRMNLLMLIFIILSLMFTVSYMIRLIYYMFFFHWSSGSYNFIEESSCMSISLIMLIMLSIVGGSLMEWMFFSSLSNFLSDWMLKLMILSICISGGLFSIMLLMLNLLKKFFYLNYFLGSMWFLNYLYYWIYMPLLNMGVNLYIVDLVWVEFKSKLVIEYIYKKMNIKVLLIFLFFLSYISYSLFMYLI